MKPKKKFNLSTLEKNNSETNFGVNRLVSAFHQSPNFFNDQNNESKNQSSTLQVKNFLAENPLDLIEIKRYQKQAGQDNDSISLFETDIGDNKEKQTNNSKKHQSNNSVIPKILVNNNLTDSTIYNLPESNQNSQIFANTRKSQINKVYPTITSSFTSMKSSLIIDKNDSTGACFNNKNKIESSDSKRPLSSAFGSNKTASITNEQFPMSATRIPINLIKSSSNNGDERSSFQSESSLIRQITSPESEDENDGRYF